MAPKGSKEPRHPDCLDRRVVRMKRPPLAESRCSKEKCHSREGGNPVERKLEKIRKMDPRLRGDDKTTAGMTKWARESRLDRV